MAILYIAVLIFAGLLLMVAELFVPGAILGLFGALLMGAGVYLSFSFYGPVMGIIVLTLSVVCVVILSALGFKYMHRTFMGRWLILSDEVSKDRGYHSDLYKDHDLLGKEGVAESELRPAGIATIEGERVDVVTDGEFVRPHTRVRVIKVDGNRVVVERV